MASYNLGRRDCQLRNLKLILITLSLFDTNNMHFTFTLFSIEWNRLVTSRDSVFEPII